MSSQNIQDAFLNNARKDRSTVTMYLTSGVKLTGRVKGFDKYCVVFETHHQEQLIFKHAISTVVAPRHGGSAQRSERGSELSATPGPPPANEPSVATDPGQDK